jgi:hypothetical protein
VGILKAGWCRKRLTASPEQPGFLKLLRARGNDAAWRRNLQQLLQTAAPQTAQWRPRANRSRRRPTASPEQPGFFRLRARGNDTVWGRATCSSRTSQRPGAWIVRIVGVVRVVRIVAGIARAEDEVAEVGEVGDEERTIDVCGVGDEGLRPHWWGLGA